MATTQLGAVLRHVWDLTADPNVNRQTDGDLLRTFLGWNEQTAFEALVRRHGPMVLRVCRRTLGNTDDAEDVLQATFLVLAQKAASIRKLESLASWLHGVAYRMATDARKAAARRHKYESRVKSTTQPQNPAASAAWQELQALLDEEIGRLSETLRAPFILCCLESKSYAEAAQQLGLQEGTIRNRLGRARKRLQEQLTRRGLSLTAVLTAAAVTTCDALSTVPRSLIRPIVEGGAQIVAGRGLSADLVSAKVMTLVKGATQAMFVTKCKSALVLLLCIAMGGGGLGAAIVRAGAEPSAQAQNPPTKDGSDGAKKERPLTESAPARPKTKAGVEVSGQVLGSDGKPFRGAELLLVPAPWTDAGAKASRSVRALSDADGRFRFAATSPEFDSGTTLVAAAAGFGPAWVETDKPPQGELNLKLVEDTPITGRVIDLEGRPIKGVAVSVQRVQTTPTEDLTPVLQAWPDGADRLLSKSLARPEWAGVSTQSTTGDDGRFRITGVGRERMAALRVEGETIESKVLHIFSRPGVDLAALTKADPEKAKPLMPRGPQPSIYGPAFEHAAQPCKPIVGVVKDKMTGKPIAGVGISGMAPNRWWEDYAQTKTDADGRFRLLGVAKASHYTISAYAGNSYLPSQQRISDSEGLKPVTANFDIVRGVLVKGRITDKETGNPIYCALWYFPMADNTFFKDLPGNDWYRHSIQGHRTEKDGTFSLTALPGSGIIMVRAENEAMGLYCEAVADPADKSKLYRDDGEGGLGQSFYTAGGSIQTLTGHHAYRLIEPQGADPFTCDIELDRGKKVTGAVVGPDGKPLAGAAVMGLTAVGGGAAVLKDASFTVAALNPARPRTIALVHQERKLAAHVTLRGDEKEPMTVKLEPWAAVAGRALDEEGNPVAGAECHVGYHPNMLRWQFDAGREKVKTDRDGRFRVEGLYPGVPFAITFVKKGKFLDAGDGYRELSVKPGQTKDLGDIKTKVYPAE